MAASQTFHDHVKELRRRILWVFLSVALSTTVAYAFRLRLINLLQHPLNAPLYYTSPAGSFNFTLKLSTIVGIFIALPVVVFQLLRFIEPALPIRVGKRLMAKVLGASFGLASAGIAFGYFCMVPLSLRFFAKYSSAQIKPLITANEYLSYLINTLIIFALVFQIPLIVLFINRIKPLKPSQLLHYQRWVIVGAFVISVVLPFTYDPVSQFIVAVPIIGLYYLSVLFLAIVNRRHKPEPSTLSPEPVVVTAPTVRFLPGLARTVIKIASQPQTPKPMTIQLIDGVSQPAPSIRARRPRAALPSATTKSRTLYNTLPVNRLAPPDWTIDGISPRISAAA